MAAPTPYPSMPFPAPVRIDYRTSGVRTLLIATPLLGLLGVASAAAALFPDRFLEGGDDPATRVMAWLCTALFLVPCLLLVIGARRLTSSQGLVFDQRGLWWFERGDHTFLAGWNEMAAVGIGFMVSPAPRTVDLIKERQGFALEIYPAGAPRDCGPRLRQVQEPPPYPNLPQVRYRSVLPPFGGVPAQVEGAVRTFAPRLWAGVYQRQWHRIPGF